MIISYTFRSVVFIPVMQKTTLFGTFFYYLKLRFKKILDGYPSKK